MKKVLCALGLMFTAVSSALATTYPLTIENCGYQETFTRPPERVVALGQIRSKFCCCSGCKSRWSPAPSGRPAFYRSWLSKTRRLKP